MLRRAALRGLPSARAAPRRASAAASAARARPLSSPPGGDGGRVTSPMSPDEFRRAAARVVDLMVEYQEGVEKMPVRSQVEPGYLSRALPAEAPEDPEEMDAILDDVRDKIMPGMTHWQSPNFFGYYPANSSGAGQLGDMLSTMFNVIGFSWVASPACTELETVVLDWLARLMALPECFLSRGKGIGVIQSSASDATLVAVLAARQRKAGVPLERLTAYTSDQAHSSVEKACLIAGIPRANVRRVRSLERDAYAVCPEAMEEAVRRDAAEGLVPFVAVATVGTTSSGAVDPVGGVADLAARHDMWSHVDAAYAGAAMVCPEHRHHMAGVERVDSFSMNCHKWLLTPFDCSPMWVRDRSLLVDALGATPEYLRNRHSEAGLVVDYKDMQVPLGRRFRSLKLWMVLRSFGARRLREHIRAGVELAARFERHVASDPRFEMPVPRSFGLVCFRLKGAGDEQNLRLLETVNATGRAFMIHTALDGEVVLRFVVGNPSTEARHVDEAWQLIREVADSIDQAAPAPAAAQQQ